MLSHRARLWAIVIMVALDIAALVASRAGAAPELLAELRPHVELVLSALLLVLVPALGDAFLVERRRRDPSVPGLVDDVTRPLDARIEMILPPPIVTPTTGELGESLTKHIEAPLPWPKPPAASLPPHLTPKPESEEGRAIREHSYRQMGIVCTTTCDHGSPCTLPAGHAGGHETEHGCIAYDPKPPAGAGGAGLAIALVIFAAALSAAVSGCGLTPVQAARHGLAGTARIGARIDRDMAAERLRVSASIRERADATRAEHDAAMEPFDEALEVTVDVRDAHLTAQAALDAVEHGQERAWRPLMTCVLSATSRLVGIAARRVELPAEVGEVLQLLAGLAQGACPEPEREPGPELEPAAR